MAQLTYDPCLIYLTTTPFGLVSLQTDDTLIIVDAAFVNTEETELQKAGLIVKKKEQLTNSNKLKFNSKDITL